MARELKPYGLNPALGILMSDERQALQLRPHMMQGSLYVAATSRTAALRRFGLTPYYRDEVQDLVGANVHGAEIAMAHPDKVVVMRQSNFDVPESAPDFVLRDLPEGC